MKSTGKITMLIQARMGSRRFPNKILKKIENKPMIWHIINRVKHVKKIQQIIVVTTRKKEDQVLAKITQKSNVSFFAGNTNDVLDRFYQCSVKFNADPIIRITGDCPLVDPKLIKKYLNFYISHDYDYVTNTLKTTFPDGLDIEIFSLDALRKAAKNAKLKSEREHVTPYIRKNRKFKKYNFSNKKNFSKYRWTVDENQDLFFIKKIYSEMKPKLVFYMNDVLKIISRNPWLLEINSGIMRNEGYRYSLKHDKRIK